MVVLETARMMESKMDTMMEIISFWILQVIIMISLTFFCGSSKKVKAPSSGPPSPVVSNIPNQPIPKSSRQDENVPGGKSEKEKKSKKGEKKVESKNADKKEEKKSKEENQKEQNKRKNDNPKSAIRTLKPAQATDKGDNNKDNLVSNPIVSNVTELYPSVTKNVGDLPVEKTQASIMK